MIMITPETIISRENRALRNFIFNLSKSKQPVIAPNIPPKYPKKLYSEDGSVREYTVLLSADVKSVRRIVVGKTHFLSPRYFFRMKTKAIPPPLPKNPPMKPPSAERRIIFKGLFVRGIIFIKNFVTYCNFEEYLLLYIV
jgi:hypothetical protein